MLRDFFLLFLVFVVYVPVCVNVCMYEGAHMGECLWKSKVNVGNLPVSLFHTSVLNFGDPYLLFYTKLLLDYFHVIKCFLNKFQVPKLAKHWSKCKRNDHKRKHLGEVGLCFRTCPIISKYLYIPK